MSALDLSRIIIEPFELFEMVWPDATYRYCTCPGFINWNGFNWLSIDDTQGQIMSLGGYSEGAGEVPNRDIGLSYTSTLGGYLRQDKWGALTIKNYLGERNPSSGAIQVDTDYISWKCNEFSCVPTESINLILMQDIGRSLMKSDALKVSSEHRKTLVSTTDYAFDKISGIKSGGQQTINNIAPTYGSKLGNNILT